MDSSSNEKNHAGKYTDIIVNYIDGFHYEMIPADVIQYAKMVIMEKIGVAF